LDTVYKNAYILEMTKENQICVNPSNLCHPCSIVQKAE
jgi:hypothetical protein